MKLKPYPLWPAFVLVVVLMGVEIKEASDNMVVNLLTHVSGPIPQSNLYWILTFVLFAYFLMCVWRFHTILRAETGGAYPIKPAAATFFHFIPLFNIYWMFAWPIRFSAFVKRDVKVRSIVCGLALVVFSIVAAFYARSIGLLGMFLVMAYLTNRLRHYVHFLDVERSASALTTPANADAPK